MAGRCLQLLESQEKEASILMYMDDESGTNEKQRERMKKLLAQGIKHELTQRQRDCIGMKYIHKMTAEEIAAELDITAATVYKHIRMAKKRLKKLNYYL